MISYTQVALLKSVAQAATLPTPSDANSGTSISSWHTGGVSQGFGEALIGLTADGAATVTSPKLYGYGPYGAAGAEGWFLIGDLNSGTAISLTATVGYSQIMQFPGVFTRLAVGGTVSANNVGYTFTPIMVAG